MNQSFRSVLLGTWIGSVVTFVAVGGYLIANEQSIDVHGEISEALGGVGIPLFVFFLLVTIVVLIVSQNKKVETRMNG